MTEFTQSRSSSTESLESRVVAMAAAVFALDPPLPDLEFGSVPAWDSIGHINLMLELEIRFAIDVPPDAIPELLSIAKICAWLKERGR